MLINLPSLISWVTKMVYKYVVENELKSINDLSIELFRSYIEKLNTPYKKIVFFNSKGKHYSYFCTKCQHWHFIPKKNSAKFEKGEYLTCGNCNSRLQVIHSHNVIEPCQKYITLLEINQRKELIIRVFYYSMTYDKKYGDFKEYFLEVERINRDRQVAVKKDSYKGMGWGSSVYHATNGKGWKLDRTEFYKFYRYDNVFNSDEVSQLITDTYYKYSCLDIAANNNIDILDYLHLWIGYPKVELLMKAGCTQIVKDICHTHSFSYDAHPHLLKKLTKQDIKFIIETNATYREADMAHETQLYDIEIIRKAIKVNFKIISNLNLKMNIEKTIDYILEKNYKYTDYCDYLQWCELLGIDLKRTSNLYPEDPKMAHDEMYKEKIKHEDHIYDNKIKEYSNELQKYSFSNKTFVIFPASSQTDLIFESVELKHCVRTYADRYANRETSIFFIRHIDNVTKPYVTLELKGKKVIQCRGYKNNIKVPLDESVKVFVNDWCKKFRFSSCFS